MTIPPGATNIVKLPLAFVRSDAVNVNDGKLWDLGQYGRYWSRTASSSTYGRNLWFNPIDVSPSGSYGRWNGFSLRCLYPYRRALRLYRMVCYFEPWSLTP